MPKKNLPLVGLILIIILLNSACSGLQSVPDPIPVSTDTIVPIKATDTQAPPTQTIKPPTPTPSREIITSGNLDRLIATWGFDIPDDSFRAIAFSPDDLTLVVGSGQNNESPDQKLRSFDMQTGQLIAESEETGSIIWDIAYSPDGSVLAVGLDSGIVQFRGPRDLSQSQQFYFPGPVNSLSFSPDGNRLAAGVADNGDGKVYIIDLSTGETQLSFRAHPYSVADMDFSPDGSLLATGAVDRATKVWDSTTGELIQSLPQEGQGSAVAFSHNGGLLASGYCAKSEDYVCQEGGILLWSTTTWDVFRNLSGGGNWIEDLVFSKNDDLVIGADRYEYLHLWQVNDGAVLRVMRISSYGSYALALSSDGRSLAAGSAFRAGLFQIGQ